MSIGACLRAIFPCCFSSPDVHDSHHQDDRGPPGAAASTTHVELAPPPASQGHLRVDVGDAHGVGDQSLQDLQSTAVADGDSQHSSAPPTPHPTTPVGADGKSPTHQQAMVESWVQV